MFGGIDEANAMAGVREKGSARPHAGQMTAFAFAAQVLLDATLSRHQTDQGFRLMGIELIGDKDPGRLGISLNGLGNVSGKVSFGARGSNAGRHDLSASHLQIGDQRLGAMALVFEFLAFDMTGLHGQGWLQTLKRLDAGHLIGAHHMRARPSQCWGRLIDLAHCADLLGQVGGILGRRSEPIPLAMGLQSAHLLKTVGAMITSQ